MTTELDNKKYSLEKDKKTTAVIYRIPEHLKNKLIKRANEDGMSMNSIVINAITEYLKEE